MQPSFSSSRPYVRVPTRSACMPSPDTSYPQVLTLLQPVQVLIRSIPVTAFCTLLKTACFPTRYPNLMPGIANAFCKSTQDQQFFIAVNLPQHRILRCLPGQLHETFIQHKIRIRLFHKPSIIAGYTPVLSAYRSDCLALSETTAPVFPLFILVSRFLPYSSVKSKPIRFRQRNTDHFCSNCLQSRLIPGKAGS